jgi:hypothetical protein
VSLKVQQLNSRTPPAGEEFGFRSCNCLLINGESRHLEALQEFAYTADLFITESRGKIGIAKEGYVVSGGGWMSDCSVVYLALSRPVVLQDTGWTHAIAPSRGLLAFRDARDCADRLKQIMRPTAARLKSSHAQSFRRRVR